MEQLLRIGLELEAVDDEDDDMIDFGLADVEAGEGLITSPPPPPTSSSSSSCCWRRRSEDEDSGRKGGI